MGASACGQPSMADADGNAASEARKASCPALSRIQHLMIQLGNALGARLAAVPRDASRYPMRFASDKSAPPSIRGHSDLQVSGDVCSRREGWPAHTLC